MSEEQRKYTADLEDKVRQYEGMLGEVLAKKKAICTVTGGPDEIEGVVYYRVREGSNDRVVAWTPALFGATLADRIRLDDEIVVIGESIVSVLPKKLEIPKEKLSLTKLVKWEEIGGIKSQVQIIRQAIEGPMKNAKLAKELGVQPIKGLLLYGPPGCGKTMIGKAIARTVLEKDEVDAEAFTYMKGAEVLAPLVGVAEQRIRSVFAEARKYSRKKNERAVIFIDEAESILPKRGSRFSSDVDTTIVPAFLAEMDGFDDHSPIVILATNRPEQLDSAAVREGRIDIRVEITRPTPQDMHEMLAIHLHRVKTAEPKYDLALHGAELIFANGLSQRASGAIAAAMVNIAATNALNRCSKDRGQAVGVTKEDIDYSYNVLKQDTSH